MTDTQPLMTSEEAREYINQAPAQCKICGGVALFGVKGPLTICMTCLYCCRRCKVFLPLDADYHYCPDCSEDMEFSAWDKTQP